MFALLASLAAASASPAGVRAPVEERNRSIIEVSDIDSLSLSPDGKTLLFRTNRADTKGNSYVLSWFAYDTARGKVVPLGSGGEAVISDPGILRADRPIWLEGSQLAALRMRDEGATGLWVYRPDAGHLSLIVTGEADVEAPRIAPDGKSILYDVGPTRKAIIGAEDAERDGGIKITPRVDLMQNLYRGGSVEGRKATQRLIGYWFMRGGLLADAPRQTRRWDAGTGKDAIVGAPVKPPPFDPPPLDRAAYLAAAGGGEASAYWDGYEGRLEWKRPDGTVLTCAAPQCRSLRAASLSWRKEGRELLVSMTDRQRRQTLATWDLQSNRVRVVASADGQLSGDRQFYTPCAIGKTAAFCVKALPAGPPELVRVDLDTGKIVPLFDPNQVLRRNYRPIVERMMFKLDDGTPINGLLLSPAHNLQRPAPLFINYYSCNGFLRGGEGDDWPMAALVDAGVLVACINGAPMRGSYEAPRAYDYGLQAVRSLIDRLDREGRVDRQKVAMGGFSFGSEVAMWVAMKSDLLAAVSIASAQSEPAEYWAGAIQGPAYEKMSLDVWGIGPPDETPDIWKKRSPAYNTRSIKEPILFQLPEQEARRITELFVRLRNGGTPVEFWAYPDEAHIKVEPKHRLAVFERNFDWLTYWLTGERDPDPSKREQYRQWDEMRARQSGGAH